MHKQILKLSIPNIISNITIPLLGMIDIIIMGYFNDVRLIAAMGIGTAIFNLIYWNFGFLRMGTSGFTAQAYGAQNAAECATVFIRGLVLSLSISFVILLLQYPLLKLALYILNSNLNNYHLVYEYFSIRIWAAPATLLRYVTAGWFVGMQNAKIPMFISIVANIVNAICSFVFAIPLGMGIGGIALGTVIAQYLSLIIALITIYVYYSNIFDGALNIDKLKENLKLKELGRFFKVNSDIFIRSIFMCSVFTFFTSASSKLEDDILALNTIFMQLFILFSYFMDGFAYAAEALIGRFVGAKDNLNLRITISDLHKWGLGVAVIFTIVYYEWLNEIVIIFIKDSYMLSLAQDYRLWIALIPICSFLAFVYDGIMIGATRSKELRNTMFIAVLGFFGVYYFFVDRLYNTALWIAMLTFLFLRGVLLFFRAKSILVNKV